VGEFRPQYPKTLPKDPVSPDFNSFSSLHLPVYPAKKPILPDNSRALFYPAGGGPFQLRIN